MAVHATVPPPGAEPFVRGDPCSFLLRFRVDHVDVDITTWVWRCQVRDRIDGKLINECETFTVLAPDDVPWLYTEPGATPCILQLHWTMEQTAQWKDGCVCDVEQLAPEKRTWVIFDRIAVDRDVSYDGTTP